MAEVKRDETSICFECDDRSDTFKVYPTNRGEPFRSGIEIGIDNDEFKKSVMVMLTDSEVKKLRDLLNRLYPN